MYLRKGNLQFFVTQDNEAKTLFIEDFKKAIDERREGDYFGFEEGQVKGNDFKKFLPEDINEIIDDNIEFTQEGVDLGEVLSKIINFKVVTLDNQMVEMNVYSEREISDLEKLKFKVTLEPKIHLREKIKSILDSISTIQDVTHKQTGLINDQSFVMVLDEVMDFLYDSKLEGVLAVVTLEGFPNFRMENGREKADEILGKIGHVMKMNFRARDVVAYLGLGKFAVILVKTFEDEVIYPVKRLESSLKKAGVLNSKLSYNVRYKQMDLTSEVGDEIEQVKTKKIDYTMSV